MTSFDFSSLGTSFPYDRLVPDALREPKAARLIPETNSHLGLMFRAVLGWRPLRLDLHLPAEIDGPVPVVAYVHGGSFIGGVPEMGPWTDLPRHGIAVAAISYRLAGEAAYPASVEDVCEAVKWLTDHAHQWGLDTERIALWGSSVGGFLVGIAALGSKDNNVSAVICHYPLTDCGRLIPDALPGGEESAHNLAAILHSYLPVDAPGMAITDFCNSKEGLPPFLIVHGTADVTVSPRQSERLHHNLIAAGGESILRMVDRANHGSHHFYSTVATDEVVKFLSKVWGRD